MGKLQESSPGERVLLLGLGVVGQAILQAHLKVGIPVDIIDTDQMVIELIDRQIQESWPDWKFKTCTGPEPGIYAGQIRRCDHLEASPLAPTLLIESVAERLEVKQDIFRRAEHWYPASTLLCSNTSTLPIHRIAESLEHPGRVIGMHFFMPVDQRDGVEMIASSQTNQSTTKRCFLHARKLGKTPFLAGDGPGFIVNRMLAPYINLAINLLCQGAKADQIETAAMSFGMPLSPLELVDLIGTRTVYEGGRTYMQAFPDRMNPSPLLPALVKNQLKGQQSGVGFYRYQKGVRSADLSTESNQFVDRYTRNLTNRTTKDIEVLLALSMWIEAKCLLRDKIAQNPQAIDDAMAGGLGFGPHRFHEYFDRLEVELIRIHMLNQELLRYPPWVKLP